MKKGTIHPNRKEKKSEEKHVFDRGKLYREIYCDNCERQTTHIYCKLRYHIGLGYVCFCGQERG